MRAALKTIGHQHPAVRHELARDHRGATLQIRRARPDDGQRLPVASAQQAGNEISAVEVAPGRAPQPTQQRGHARAVAQQQLGLRQVLGKGGVSGGQVQGVGIDEGQHARGRACSRGGGQIAEQGSFCRLVGHLAEALENQAPARGPAGTGLRGGQAAHAWLSTEPSTPTPKSRRPCVSWASLGTELMPWRATIKAAPARTATVCASA